MDIEARSGGRKTPVPGEWMVSVVGGPVEVGGTPRARYNHIQVSEALGPKEGCGKDMDSGSPACG